MTTKEKVYTDRNEYHVVVMSKAVERLNSHRQLQAASLEAAGVLIGERRGNHLVIHDISEPGFGDIRQRYRVDRQGSHHQKIVDNAFEASAGTFQYLGEWHTHPERFPSPSPIDLESWNSSLSVSSPMILLIVGIDRFWVGKKVMNQIFKLEEKLGKVRHAF